MQTKRRRRNISLLLALMLMLSLLTGVLPTALAVDNVCKIEESSTQCLYFSGALATVRDSVTGDYGKYAISTEATNANDNDVTTISAQGSVVSKVWAQGLDPPNAISATCTVSFHGNGGTPATQLRTVAINTTVGANMPANPERSGYSFTGWNTVLNGSGTEFTATTPVNADITVYALWSSDDVKISDDYLPLSEFNTEHILYIFGYLDNSIRPDNAMTRAEVAVVLYRLLVTEEKYVPKPSIFSDVTVGTWYTQAVSYLADIGVLAGYPDGTFRPNQPLTRAEFATIASRFNEMNTMDTIETIDTIETVETIDTTDAIKTINITDTTDAIKSTSITDNTDITKSTSITDTTDTIKTTNITDTTETTETTDTMDGSSFQDIENHWAEDCINSVAQKGWVNGYPDGTFKPQQNITRAEAVKIVNMMLNRKIESENIPEGIKEFTDIENHWAYAHLVEASNNHGFERNSDGYEIWCV